MATTQQPTQEEDNPDINLSEAAQAYETERQLNRLAQEIERYSPDLLGLLADAAMSRVDKSEFATRVHKWQDGFGKFDELA